MLNIVAGLENVFRFLGACFMVNSFVRDKATCFSSGALMEIH